MSAIQRVGCGWWRVHLSVDEAFILSLPSLQCILHVHTGAAPLHTAWMRCVWGVSPAPSQVSFIPAVSSNPVRKHLAAAAPGSAAIATQMQGTVHGVCEPGKCLLWLSSRCSVCSAALTRRGAPLACLTSSPPSSGVSLLLSGGLQGAHRLISAP